MRSEAHSGEWIDPARATLAPLAEREIVVLGYGSQGRAQALNLRDAGAGRRVRVWTRPEGPGARQAIADGFPLLGGDDLGCGDLYCCLLPDELHAEFLMRTLAPALTAAGREAELCFAHGFSLAFTSLGAAARRPPWREVFLVAPSGPGEDVRRARLAGGGVPAFLGVWHDASGEARQRAIGVATALGSFAAGVFATEVRTEAVVDLFGEQAVLCGGVSALLAAAFDTLVTAGYPPEMAYAECIQQLHLTVGLIERHGIAGMRARISPTARFGDLTRGPRIVGAATRSALRRVLEEIESGHFAHEWVEEQRRGAPRFAAAEREAVANPLEAAGREVRRRATRAVGDESRAGVGGGGDGPGKTGGEPPGGAPGAGSAAGENPVDS